VVRLIFTYPVSFVPLEITANIKLAFSIVWDVIEFLGVFLSTIDSLSFNLHYCIPWFVLIDGEATPPVPEIFNQLFAPDKKKSQNHERHHKATFATKPLLMQSRMVPWVGSFCMIKGLVARVDNLACTTWFCNFVPNVENLAQITEYVLNLLLVVAAKCHFRPLRALLN